MLSRHKSLLRRKLGIRLSCGWHVSSGAWSNSLLLLQCTLLKYLKSMSIKCIIKLYVLYVRYMNGDYSLK